MGHPNNPSSGSATPPASTTSAPAAAPAAAHHSAGEQASEMMNETMAMLKSRFSVPELLAGGGALLVFISYVLFGFLGGAGYSSAAILLAAAAIFFIAGQRLGLMDFGASYRTAVILLGFLMAVILVVDFLYTIRNGLGGGAYTLRELFDWVGEAAVAAGAFLLWRSKA